MYFAEVSDVGSNRKAEPLRAKTLTAAKREASRRPCFYCTCLIIGTELNEHGFIKPECVVATKVSGKWMDLFRR